MKISIADGRGALWQWDTGRRLRVGSGVEQIHWQLVSWQHGHRQAVARSNRS